MTIAQRVRHIYPIVASILLCGVGPVSAEDPVTKMGGEEHGGRFGPHPTMPVPSVLIFGGLAVGAAVIATRRRKHKSQGSEDGSK